MWDEFEEFLRDQQDRTGAKLQPHSVKNYRSSASTARQLAESRGLRCEGAADASALLTAQGLDLSSDQKTALRWLVEYYESKESPERYSDEEAFLEDFEKWGNALGNQRRTVTNQRARVKKLFGLLRERGLPIPATAADLRRLEEKEGNLVSKCSVLTQLSAFLEKRQTTSSSAGLSAEQLTRKRPREVDSSWEVEEEAPANVTAACLGRVVDGEGVAEALGPLTVLSEGSFFFGKHGHYEVTPSEQPHATLSVALTCPKRDDGEKKVNHLIAFESHSIRQAGDKYLNLYGQGDLPFKHGMLAAVAAVRLRAAGLCGLLGVRDVDAAVERICNKKRTFQLVLEAHPRGVKKEGSSGTLAAALSVVALMSGRHLRRGLATTGDLALSGRVLGIGGLTEKLEIAKQCGIKTVICPLTNLKEYQAELKGNDPGGLELVGVERLEEAVRVAFEPAKETPAAPLAEEAKVDDRSPEADGTDKPLPVDEGLYWGAAQSLTWHVVKGKMYPCVAEVEVALLPGRAKFNYLSHRYDTGSSDIDVACSWLSEYQERIVPMNGRFLLPDFASQVGSLDVTIKVNPSGELHESNLRVASVVALISAVTGYKYNPKIRVTTSFGHTVDFKAVISACIVGSMTGDGTLLPLTPFNEADLTILSGSEAKVVVVPHRNKLDIEAIWKRSAEMKRLSKSRFVGVKNLLEALPHVLLKYPSGK